MTELPPELRETLEAADRETLQATREFVESQLAEMPAATQDETAEESPEPPDEFEGDADDWAAAVDDTEAPRRATTTTKRINGNEYYYYQWSEDGATKSEYIAPKNPSR